MSKKTFTLQSEFKPAGDQPQAIAGLVKGIEEGVAHQTLLGVTGSGKTFTVANVIEAVGKPTLVIAHNKTLAAQLAQEYRDFFPNHAVHYFVSYYDYYQPEAYLPVTDTYIEKETQINEEIDRLRHASTQALLTRDDVIIVASVSAIYGLGSPAEYEKNHLKISVGMEVKRNDFIRQLIAVFFERTTADLTPGMFRAIGNTIEVMPVNERVIYRIEMLGPRISTITKIDEVTRQIIADVDVFFLFPAKHFVTDKEKLEIALKNITSEMEDRVKELQKEGMNLEAERMRRRTKNDLALLREIGYCNGIENYSRHLTGRQAGEAPETLLSYFPHKADGTPDFLTVIDESHVTIPQIGGMHAGDAARKKNLIAFGFRLPSALDNRPLTFAEFEERVGQVIYTSATPGTYEKESLEKGGRKVEQIIRPTGLLDPELIVRPIVGIKGDTGPARHRQADAEGSGAAGGQVQDFIEEAVATVEKGDRVMVTTLTKKMAEDLTDYLKERGIKAEYVHSDVKTIDRIKILTDFRKGAFDCLVGVNLLREGLDLPEVSLVGILDADKEGFLRSETSLIQTIGRAARNVNGRVILYADTMTGSMQSAIDETNRRRTIQSEYNKKHGITPATIKKAIADITEHLETEHQKTVGELLKVDRERYNKNPKQVIAEKEKRMEEAVKILDFETAAIIRDEIKALVEGE